MRRISLAVGLGAAALALVVARAEATFHIMVIDQVFPGFEQAPDAQYVMMRIEADVQSLVNGQSFATFDAAGDALDPFGGFCPTPSPSCRLPKVSPACAQGGCSSTETNDGRLFVATQRAADLFCLAPDLLATGGLPYPDGRVCFGNTGSFSATCFTKVLGPVDCVAYGNYTGDNGIFGSPAASPALGDALVGSPARTAQCLVSNLNQAAVCAGGSSANQPCAVADDCMGGTCVQCPAGGCVDLLNNAVGFSVGVPSPRNFHGDVGGAGVAGDPQGTGVLSADDVGAEVSVLFETDHRCDLPAARRGADANLDTRINAADLVATITLVTATAT